ncbi:MAG: PASTA domain-containing protein [Selenomonadales bacterium]|nr:PASTA domain-containing protein [Selenomonadales bacterium]MBR0325650.1 PASTA domain-containing protein [Selenomonadales bacterium]
MKKTNLQINKRTNKLIFFLVFLLIIAVGRLAWLQIVVGDDLTDKFHNMSMREYKLQSPRGGIYDRNGRELAISIETKSLFVDPKVVMENAENMSPQEAVSLIAPIVNMAPEELMKLIERGGQFAWVKRHLETNEIERINEVRKNTKIKGFAYYPEVKRYYPLNSVAAQVLGFVNQEDKGIIGVENMYNDILKGSVTMQKVTVDNYGRTIGESVHVPKFIRDGKAIYLTIDSQIQCIAEAAMDEAMTVNKTNKGTIIVIDPKTGEILAMVSRPTFDPNKLDKLENDRLIVNGITHGYEPGSTFKAVVAAMAIEEKVVSPNEVFHDSGYIKVSGHTMKNWDGKGHGNVTFTDIIKNSLNTGFAQVGLRLGGDRLISYAKKFGFGQETNIEMPGEERGFLFRSARDMVDSDIATMSIGQSILVTPIQVLMAVSSLANEGVLLQPRIIREIKNADGSVYESHKENIVVRQTVSAETANTMKGLLEKVISEGGGSKAQIPGYRVAGKTGTAQKVEKGVYKPGEYIASFVGFAPVENPRLAVIVVIDTPSGNSYYGGQVAAPVAKKILHESMRYLNILPNETAITELPRNERQTPQAMPSVKEKKGLVTVPDVRGKSMKEAMRALMTAGLTMIPEGTGIAVSQDITPFSSAQAGSAVRVRFEPR